MERKEPFQRVLFPEGITFEGEKFGTTCLAFSSCQFRAVNLVWRPVRESNPCRRREREATYGNSRKLCGMDSTLQHLTDSRERFLDL